MSGSAKADPDFLLTLERNITITEKADKSLTEKRII